MRLDYSYEKVYERSKRERPGQEEETPGISCLVPLLGFVPSKKSGGGEQFWTGSLFTQRRIGGGVLLIFKSGDSY